MSSFNLFFYCLSLPLLLLSSNWIILLFCLELNLFAFLWILNNTQSSYNISFFLNYFLIQSINSLAIILSILTTTGEITSTICFLFFFANIGLPPFFIWLLGLINFISTHVLFYLITLQNLPLFLLLSTFLNANFFFFLTLFLFFSSLGLWNQLAFNNFFFFSSISNSCLILLSALVSNGLFWTYLSIYIFSIIIYLAYPQTNFLNVTNINLNSLNLISIFFFLLGLPPSPLFFINIFLFINLLSTLPLWTMTLIFLSMIIPIFIYMQIIVQINFSNPQTPPSTTTFWSHSWLILIVVLIL